MKTHALFLTAGLLILSTACEKNEKEDLAFAYRSDYTGSFFIDSITDDEGKVWDLNDDGAVSLNLFQEFYEGQRLISSFNFSQNKEGYYDGLLSFVLPLQGISAGTALPPYSVDTPCSFSGMFVNYVCAINMKLMKDGSTSWEPFLTEYPTANEMHIKFLRGGRVDAVHDRQIDITIQEVPIFDCKEKKLEIRTLHYHLIHE